MLENSDFRHLAYMFQAYYFQAWDDVFGDDSRSDARFPATRASSCR